MVRKHQRSDHLVGCCKGSPSTVRVAAHPRGRRALRAEEAGADISRYPLISMPHSRASTGGRRGLALNIAAWEILL